VKRVVLAALAILCMAQASPDPDDPPELDDKLAQLADAPPTFDPAQQRPVGFDHRIHDRNLIVSGKEALACTRCHALAQGRIVGKPAHEACFGACHGAAPAKSAQKIAVPADQIRVCTACHAGAALAARASGKRAKLGVPYPPYTIDRDFGLTMSHKGHAQVACDSCHFTKQTGPHARCVACHAKPGGAAPAMTACASCHPDAYGPAAGPRMVENPLALDGFDHARHRLRSTASCTSCHVSIAAADGATLDPPATAACATCHDGKAAFATTGACTRCHTRAPTITWRPARPLERFSHAAHAPRIGDVACTSCHAIDRRGEATAPSHEACVACHAADFSSAAPAICGACHIATEPWRKMIADRPPPPETEFGAKISHAAHAGDCATCHTTRSSERELRPPRGHAACASCHAKQAPKLDDCNGCHQLALAADRTRDRLAAAWSVRARFRHATHALPCTSCHDGVAAATSLGLVPSPKKAACAGCHDGGVAFKLTGTTCATCHGPRS